MNKKSIAHDSGKGIFILCIILVIAMLVFGAVFTVTVLSDNLRSEHIKAFEATVDQSAQTLSITVSSTKEYARLLTQAFETDFVPGTDLTAYAESRVMDTNLLNGVVVCIDSAGNTYTTDNTHTGVWQNKEVLASTDKELVTIDYLTGPPDPKYLLVVEKLDKPEAAKYHGRTVNITHAAVGRTIPYINSLFTAAFPVPADTFIVKDDGKMLSASYDLAPGVKGNVFITGDISGVIMDEKDAAVLSESVQKGTSAHSDFSFDGKKYTVFTSRIPGMDAWAVVVINPDDLDAELQTSISNLFVVMILFVLVIGAAGACLAFFVVRSKADREVIAKKEEANRYLEQASREKSAFMFNMSHDIRTPLNAILGFTNIARKNIDDREKLQNALEKTQSSGQLLLSLINSILDVSRIESGKAVLAEDKGDFLLSFVNIEDSLNALAASKDIALTFEIGSYKDRYVICDFMRCGRVFLNLISNAIKFTSPGGWVKVHAEQLDTYIDGRGVYRYTVEDNGRGMSEEFQEQMFEEFSRELTSTQSGIEGTGLGLSVCKAFVDLMGGTITCDSKQGVGTKFTVDLPFVIQEGEEFVTPGIVVKVDEKETSVLEGRRVLLVEDNEMNREIALDLLTEAKMNVETAEDGSVAVQMLEENGPVYYDFVLMDIQMPVMDGYEATRVIRNMDGFSELPIIAVSANAFEEDRRASLAAGMNDHVAKPIDVNLLMQTMAKYFK